MFARVNLGIYIWDVSHGLAVTIVTPYKRVLAYNAGRSPTFSPLQMLSGIGVIWLDCFVLSHPHPDHLRDIDALIALRPLLLWRRKLPKERIREGAEPGREESVVDRYQRELDHVYTQPATPSPTDYGWGGCEFRAFSPPEHPNLNNTSIVLFAGYGGGCVHTRRSREGRLDCPHRTRGFPRLPRTDHGAADATSWAREPACAKRRLHS